VSSGVVCGMLLARSRWEALTPTKEASQPAGASLSARVDQGGVGRRGRGQPGSMREVPERCAKVVAAGTMRATGRVLLWFGWW
jgi:hypothetical protein